MNRLLSRVLAVFCILLAAGTVVQAADDYYVDAVGGDNNNDGKSTGAAWKTVAKVNQMNFGPGDRVFFKRGQTFSGTTLDARWDGTSSSKITFGAYGSGAKPILADPSTGQSAIVKITGSYQVFENLHVKLTSLPTPDGDGRYVLYRIGFAFNDDACYNDVKSCTLEWLAAGVAFAPTTHHNAVFSNVFDYICLYWPEGNHYNGSICVNLKGDYNNVSWNTFKSSGSDFEATENAVELYNARDCRIHHNKAFGVRVFSETGSFPVTGVSERNAYEYNLHSSDKEDARFLVTRGEGHTNGPVKLTTMFNNTVFFTGASSRGVVLQNGSALQNLLEMRNNIIFVRRATPGSLQERCFWATGDHYTQKPYMTESHNLYYSDIGTVGGICRIWDTVDNQEIHAVIDSTSAKTDPVFVNLGAGDFHLQSSSPARNSGTAVGNYTADLDQVQVKEQTKDRGAYEFVP